MNSFAKKLKGLLMSTGQLPSGYKLCEYLESTGTQYIKTGVFPTNNTAIESKVTVLDLTKSRFIGVTDGTNRFSILLPTAGTGYLVNQIGTINKPLNNIGVVLKVGDTVIIKNDKGNLYYNGILVDSVTPNKFISTVELTIAAQNTYQTAIVAWDISRHYYHKVWNNGVLIRDFIPCLDNNNRPCMYDTVSKQTFYNQGTGEFLYKQVDDKEVWSGNIATKNIKVAPQYYINSTGDFLSTSTNWVTYYLKIPDGAQSVTLKGNGYIGTSVSYCGFKNNLELTKVNAQTIIGEVTEKTIQIPTVSSYTYFVTSIRIATAGTTTFEFNK